MLQTVAASGLQHRDTVTAVAMGAPPVTPGYHKLLCAWALAWYFAVEEIEEMLDR